jgi:hypothetical protein
MQYGSIPGNAEKLPAALGNTPSMKACGNLSYYHQKAQHRVES